VGQQLLEAGDNGEGKLQAKGPTDYKLKRKAWKRAPGFAESDVPVKEPVPFKEGNIETFVQKFNANAGDYSLLMNNCQEFVRQLLTELKIENIWGLSGIKSNMMKVAAWSAASSTSLSRTAFDTIGKEIVKIGRGPGSRKLLDKISLTSSQSISLLGEIAKTAKGKAAAEAGKDLALNATGELIERMMQGMQGALTWWQLLQIPVEVGTKWMMESKWFKTLMKEELGWNVDDNHSYAVSKAASLATATAVGGVVTGGAGIVGAVLFWFAAELVTFGLRWLAGYVSSWFTKDGSDYFEQWLGPSQTMKLLKWVVGENPQTAILEYMKRYIMSTQTKKIE